MKSIKYLILVAILSCLAACGGKNNDVTLKVESELGELGNYVSLSDKEIVVNLSDDKEDGVDCKVIASSLALNVSKSVASDRSFDLDVEVLDENHLKICDLPEFEVESSRNHDNGDFDHILSSGTIRAQMKDIKEVSEWTEEDQLMWNKIHDSGAYIVVKPKKASAKYVAYDGSDSKNVDEDDDDDSADESVDEEISSSGSEDWDALLDAYDSYVTEYISFAKKVASGDVSALAEYSSIMEKAQEFSNKMSGAEGEMSASQWARYMKITSKMTTAASGK